jgi:hypothetical protein
VKGNARIGGKAIILGGVWDGTEGPVTEGKWESQDDYLAWKSGQ